jgi:hypothetical protein
MDRLHVLAQTGASGLANNFSRYASSFTENAVEILKKPFLCSAFLLCGVSYLRFFSRVKILNKAFANFGPLLMLGGVFSVVILLQRIFPITSPSIPVSFRDDNICIIVYPLAHQWKFYGNYKGAPVYRLNSQNFFAFVFGKYKSFNCETDTDKYGFKIDGTTVLFEKCKLGNI